MGVWICEGDKGWHLDNRSCVDGFARGGEGRRAKRGMIHPSYYYHIFVEPSFVFLLVGLRFGLVWFGLR